VVLFVNITSAVTKKACQVALVNTAEIYQLLKNIPTSTNNCKFFVTGYKFNCVALTFESILNVYHVKTVEINNSIKGWPVL